MPSPQPSRWLLALMLCTACQGPEPAGLSSLAQVKLVLPPAPAPADGLVSTRTGASTPTGSSGAPQSPSQGVPIASRGGSGGGSGGSGGGLQTPPTAYLRGPNGETIPVSDSEAIALPLGLNGQWSLFLPGDVPSTIEVPSGNVTLHPSSILGSPLPSAFATISGTLATPRGGIDVQYLSRGRTIYAGATTQANGSFTFSLPVSGQESGLVLARNLSAYPDLGLAAVSVGPGASATVDALALAAPDASATGYRVLGLSSGTATPAALPELPSGLDYTAGRLQVAMSDAQGPWRATVLVLSSPVLPSYSLPGFTLVDSYEAASNDGLRHAETSGPQGQVPDFLTPPDLSAVSPTFKAGTTLAWPAVAGASLYTLSLAPDNQATSPIWEGATTQPTLTLPANLTLQAQDVWLQIDAWDAAGVDIYSVASLRALRVPNEPQGPSGRHSWARLAGSWQP